MTRLKPGSHRLIKYIVIFISGLYAAFVSNGHQTVVDGDTIRIGRETVRLNGIDAPELKQTCLCKGQKVKCGIQAKKALYDFIGSDTVVCETKERDFYRRWLGECFIQSDGKKISLNEMMIKNGLAMAKYTDRFLASEDEAVKNRRGFWGCEGFEDPKSFRSRHQRSN